MSREKVIDVGGLIKTFWKTTPEEIDYNEDENINANLTDIDTKVWKEAFSNIKAIEKSFTIAEKETKKVNKNRKNQITKTTMKSSKSMGKDAYSNFNRQEEKEIGE